LENGRSEDDKVSRRMWEAVETKVRKSRIAKTKGRKKKRKSREKMRGEESRMEVRRIVEE